jgi:hypothetical protein
MSVMTKATAAPIVEPIRAAWDEFQDAAAERVKGIVPYAIRLGEALAEAKKQVKKEGFGWDDWVNQHLADFIGAKTDDLKGIIGTSTVRDYILLAEHRHISQHAVSIRQALKDIDLHLKATGQKGTRKKTAKAEEQSGKAASGGIDADKLVAQADAIMQALTPEQKAGLAKLDEIEQDVVPGLHQAIDKRDKVGIAKSVFDRLKATQLVKAEMQEVLRELRVLVDTHAWPGEPPSPSIRRVVGQGANASN